MSSLPEQIGNLTALKVLNLSNNQLTTLPEQIRNLTALTVLNLARNQLTTLPEQIGNLTALKSLDLSQNQLTTLPEKIGKLTALNFLDLSQNQLTTLPEQVGSLAALTFLNLSHNQLTALPEQIRNLTALTNLDLENNPLTTLPNSLLNVRAGSLRDIYLLDNRISPEEAARINVLALERGVTVQISIRENYQALDNLILDKILLKASEEKRDELRTLLNSEQLGNFKEFLKQCQRTEGWKSRESEMTQSLFEIIIKMSESDAVKVKCETLAATAFGTCGDRVGLAFVQMQLALNLSDKELKDMTPQEVYDYAKQESVIKFLSNKAEAKIADIKKRGGALDEIETHLAYLQIGSDLGLDLKANGMLYKACSNVTDDDLESAKAEFLKLDHQTARHLYEDEILRTHPFVKEIIAQVSDREEFSADGKDGETSQEYTARLGNLRKLVSEATIAEIEQKFKEKFESASKKDQLGQPGAAEEKEETKEETKHQEFKSDDSKEEEEQTFRRSSNGAAQEQDVSISHPSTTTSSSFFSKMAAATKKDRDKS